VAAETHPAASRSALKILDTSGDNPPTTVATFTGQRAVSVVGFPMPGDSAPSGTLNLAGLPAGATIQAAWLVAIEYSGVSAATLTFAGQALPSAASTWTDAGYPLQVWRWDVTSLVAGNGSYAFSIPELQQPYGAALVVVYGHATLPFRTIVVNMGAEDLSQASSTTSFAGLPTAGPGRLILLTGADDTNASAGESLAFNGGVIPGVVFDENLGPVTSLIDVAVTVVQGTNTATVTTGDDQFGWALAILVGPVTAPAEVVVPGLSGTGLALLAAALALVAVAVLVRRAVLA
jgi:hypothetical protein